jgi:hypothetical protein
MAELVKDHMGIGTLESECTHAAGCEAITRAAGGAHGCSCLLTQYVQGLTALGFAGVQKAHNVRVNLYDQHVPNFRLEFISRCPI